MLTLLERMQQSLGLIGFASVFAGAGFVLGLAIGSLIRRRAASPSAPAPAAPAPTTDNVFPDTESKDKRRNPRRPGRSVEVLVCIPGGGEPCKGVVLDRSVGGLKLLVGDEYAPGSVIGVLPAAASKLTPWVEVEVKSCIKSGDDWEVGVQFQKLPPYATMVLFG